MIKFTIYEARKRGEEGQFNPHLPNAGCCTVQQPQQRRHWLTSDKSHMYSTLVDPEKIARGMQIQR